MTVSPTATAVAGHGRVMRARDDDGVQRVELRAAGQLARARMIAPHPLQPGPAPRARQRVAPSKRVAAAGRVSHVARLAPRSAAAVRLTGWAARVHVSVLDTWPRGSSYQTSRWSSHFAASSQSTSATRAGSATTSSLPIIGWLSLYPGIDAYTLLEGYVYPYRIQQ